MKREIEAERFGTAAPCAPYGFSGGSLRGGLLPILDDPQIAVERALDHLLRQSLDVGMGHARDYRKYDNVRKRLAEFLADKLRRRDIPLKELTETFITDYDLYLRSEKGKPASRARP